MKETAARLCSILADLFGPDLDRLTLWTRIESALVTAFAKSNDGDMDYYMTLCLEHVKAEAGRVAASEALASLLSQFAARPVEWRQRFVRYVNAHRLALLVHGRARWEQVKAKAVEL